MRIARIVTRLNLGGPARQILASDPRLVALGHAVRLFTGHSEPGEGDLTAAAAERGLDVLRVPGLRRRPAPVGDWRARSRLERELAAFAPEVVHTHAFKAGYLGRRAAARAVPRAARVHTFHGHVLEGYFPEPIAKRLRRLERELARTTDRIVCVSHATADDLVRLGICEEERIVVIQPGIDLEPFLDIAPRAPSTPAGVLRTLIGAGPEALVVGVVGRLAEVKRVAWPLEVLELLAARHPALQLVYVGDGPERGRLERAIAALDPALRQRVHVVGARSDMPAVFADLDVVLQTSRSEGLPVALIEAAAAARPAVATPVGGVEEVVVHERTGFLGESPTELAYGLSALCDDPGDREHTGRRARLRVGRFSGDRLAERLAELYTTVARERQALQP